MTFLSKAGACVAAALILATAGELSAQPQAEPSAKAPSQSQEEAGSQAQTSPQTPPPTAQPKSEPPPEPAERRRVSKRRPRTSGRQPSGSGRRSSEQARTSRQAGPTEQSLVFTASVLGGYDNNLAAAFGGGSGASPETMASGPTGYANAGLDYSVGNSLRSLSTGLSGNLTAYPGYLDRPAPGSVASASARTALGRSSTLNASERFGYEPLFNFLSPGASSTPLPPGIGEAVPATGLFERHSVSSTSSVSLDQRWSEFGSSAFSYSYRTQQFTEDDYGDNSSHDLAADYSRKLASGFSGSVQYGYSRGDHNDSSGDVLPSRQHRVEGGIEVQSAISRRRSLALSVNAGAGYIETIGATIGEPYHAWVPTGSANASLALSPRWSVDGGYRRDFSLLQGITDEVYTSDTAYLSTRGSLTDRMDLQVGATYSNQRTPEASGVNDTFDIYGASAQLSVALTETLAATASYNYYRHRYSNPGALPAGFPADYDRHAVRAGLTVWVPLAGTSARSR